ncbi:topoisomerase DNA-binding C4 zinc finger domain-containing protein [Aliikangiella sp. IMCC44632]
MPENVTYAKGYVDYIKSKKAPILSQAEVVSINQSIIQSIIQSIQSGRLAQSIKTNREHVKHVKEILQQKNAARPNGKICQKCGGEMLEREAKRGKNKGQNFFGCSNFPKCRNVVMS